MLRSGEGTSGFTVGPSRPGPQRGGWLRSTQRSRARTSWRPASRSALPSRHQRSRLVVRPLLTSPQQAGTSRPRPSRTTQRTRPRARKGILGRPWRPPRIRPTAFPAHPPRLRNGPLMDIGLRHAEPARPDRPALYAQPTRPQAIRVRHVFLGSRFRLRLPSHPASRRRSCPRLVVGAINLHRGLSPPSRWSCRAYSGSRGGCPSRLPQNRTYDVRIRLLGTAGYDPRRRPVCDLEVIPTAPTAATRRRRSAGGSGDADRPRTPDRAWRSTRCAGPGRPRVRG